MADKKEKTYADAFREHGESDKNFDVATGKDTVKGWNDRRQANNQVISSLIPFVQLIGLFDEKEYEKMFKTAEKTVNVVFDEGDQKSEEYDEKFTVSRDFYKTIKEQIGERFINLYIVKSVDHGLNVAPMQGVIMAEKVTQVEDASGGIGITDLQVDYGKSNVLGSRKFNIRMTINDPKILDERFEYSKLATFGAQFLLLYGWSNPETIPGYDATMSPPKLEIDPTSDSEPKRKRLIVPIRNLGNGGYWSAARVNISKYDFGFNEMGKLEINVTLRDDSTLGMSSTTMSSIAKQFKGFLDSGNLETAIVSQSGDEFTLRDALNQRQIELKQHYESIDDPSAADFAEYESQWEMAIEHYSKIVSIDGTPINAEDAAKGGDESPYWTEEDIRKITAEARSAQEGYPNQSALYTYKQIFATVLDNNPDEAGQTEWSAADATKADDDGTPASLGPTKQVVTYEKRPAFYYLGAIMDSISLSMAGPQLGLATSTVPSFYYRDVSPDSKLSTAFQSKMKSVNRATGMEERIQEAVIRLKERFLPPTPIEHNSPDETSGDQLVACLNRLVRTDWVGTEERLIDRSRRSLFGNKQHFINDVVGGGRGGVQVSGPQAVYEGFQSTERTRVIDALFPAPPKIRQMFGAPMRGFFIRVNTDSPDNVEKLKKKLGSDATGVGTLHVYLPDWKQEISVNAEGDEIRSSGSPDGFDPLNPTEYRAASPRRLFGSKSRSPFSAKFESRSQEPYGRGGRFWMVMSFHMPISKAPGEAPGRLIVPYDVWRQSDNKTWNLLQKTWHNLYREYLAAYFERVIRLRINDLEPFGIPIEAIFNEPLDLDWMTGLIYNNTDFQQHRTFLKEDVSYRNVSDLSIEEEEEKINQEASVFEDIIAKQTEIIDGKEPPSLLEVMNNPAMYTFAEFTGLRGQATRLTRKINNLKIQIELLTGGHYQRDRDGNFDTKDMMDNTIMLRFKNFSKVIASDELVEETKRVVFDPTDGLNYPEFKYITLGEYKPKIVYDHSPGAPRVTEEWVLWNDYDVPTNNFQNRFNTDSNEWDDELNKAERWKQQNDYVYKTAVVSKIDADKKLLQEKTNTIIVYQDQLNEIYEAYLESQNAIDNAERAIHEGTRKLVEFKNFFNDEGKVELSLYDDTSDFDGDGLKIEVGRAEPMHLTTRVAQQWWPKFAGIIHRGVMDVMNYGPPAGGRPFHLPTNNYQFTFDKSRRSWAAQGQPTRVLDPEFFLKIYEESHNRFEGTVKDLLKDLSHGTVPAQGEAPKAASQIISKDLPYEEFQVGHRTEKSYQSWSLFGTPGIPNENRNNEWGFRYGPPFERTLANDIVEQLGGNYVRTYKDFLDIFGLGYNPGWPESLKIVGNWPTPSETESRANPSAASRTGLAWPTGYPNSWKNQPEHQGAARVPINDAERLIEATGLPMYTLIDEVGNILVDDGNGWYRPTGWYLDFAGDPVFLYPQRETACEINNTRNYVNGVRPGGVVKMGGLTLGHHGVGVSEGDRQSAATIPYWGYADGISGRVSRYDNDGNLSGRTKKFFQAAADFIADLGKAYWASMTALASGDLVGYLEGQWKVFKLAAPVYAGIYGGPMAANLTRNLFGALRNTKTKYMNDGYMTDYMGTKSWKTGGPWGGRIGLGEHCMNLTLAMKQSMVYYRPTTEDKTNFLGVDVPGGDVNASSPPYDGGWRGDAGKTWPPYSNPKYPYGTGWYRQRRSGTEQHGPYVFPERAKNWGDWGDFLELLPGFGFLTQIDNSNYTSCVVQPSGQITDGAEMNDGFVKFVIENVYAPLPKNRRCGATNSHQPIKILGSSEGNEVDNYHENERLNDVTYGDLFGPLRDESEDEDEPAASALDPTNFGNIDNFVIDNVKSIPIRAEVVNNLVNKNNTNMSIIQFFSEIFRPGAVGVNSGGNQQVACRQGEEGTFEVFAPSSINWKQMSEKYAHLYGPGLNPDEEYFKRFPIDIIVLDFKAKDSLIESLDMNSTFDPITARAFRDASVEFTGNSDALLHFMSYKDIAPDLLEFFKKEAPHIQSEEEGGKQAITIDATGKVTLDREIFMEDNEVTQQVQNVVSKYLQANPARLNSMRALLLAYEQGKSSTEDDPEGVDNYATQLLANYMRKTTVTIHGTTNIAPFQKVIIKGIMPDLEGMYLITSTRESITPQGFQTILEGSLVRQPSDNARGKDDVNVPQGKEEDEVAKAAGPESEGTDVEEASTLPP